MDLFEILIQWTSPQWNVLINYRGCGLYHLEIMCQKQDLKIRYKFH